MGRPQAATNTTCCAKLWAASTSIVTNIRAQKGKKHRQFSWIESWTDHVDDET
jgi:hypothetical protein